MCRIISGTQYALLASQNPEVIYLIAGRSSHRVIASGNSHNIPAFDGIKLVQRQIIRVYSLDGESLLNGPERGGALAGRRPPRPRPPRGQSQRREGAPPSHKSVTWKASDPNGDELVFDLFYRGMDENDWKVIKEDIREETSYEWDTSRVPDGHYLLRLVARDDAVRPRDEALRDEKVTPPLLIDNRPPTVRDLRARRGPDGAYELSGVAADLHSHITKIQVSHNSEDWLPVFPTDGLLDSREEPFSHRTEPLQPGEHVFVFAAVDSNANTGSAKIVVRVSPQGK